MTDHILERSHALRAEFFEKEQELLDSLAQYGQSPDAMFIGCSDSRVVSELLTGARPGALFVARVVANIVPPYGTGQNAVGAAVEYAVLHLKVKDLKGRAVMVHAGGDNFSDQPAALGGGGARVACGVIE